MLFFRNPLIFRDILRLQIFNYLNLTPNVKFIFKNLNRVEYQNVFLSQNNDTKK